MSTSQVNPLLNSLRLMMMAKIHDDNKNSAERINAQSFNRDSQLKLSLTAIATATLN